MAETVTKPKTEMANIIIKHRAYDEPEPSRVQALIIDDPDWAACREGDPPSWLQNRRSDFADPPAIDKESKVLLFDMVLDSAESLDALLGIEYKHNKFGIKKTKFGFVLSGAMPTKPSKAQQPYTWCLLTGTRKPKNLYKARAHFFMPDIEVDETELINDIAKAHELDAVDIFGHADKDVDALKSYMDETIKSFQRKNGRVYVKLPKFHGMNQQLSKNQALVQAQLQKLQERFLKEEFLEESYVKAINEWIDMGTLVPVTEEELASVKYWAEMPYHPVFRKGATTHKIRIVMNGSAKAKGMASLNDYLATGPNILPQIVNILSKLRAARHFVVADIEKAFLQVGLLEPDDHLFIFRWLEKTEEGKYQQKLYRFARMPWGINSAPFVLNAVVRYLYDEAIKDAIARGNHCEAQRLESLKDTTYVDDILALGNTRAEAIMKAKAGVKALNLGQMKVTKFRSYPPELVKQVDPRAEIQTEEYKILGIRYNPRTDTMAPAADKIGDFKGIKNLSKKQAAGIGARLYDPAGWTAPVQLQAKILMQKLEQDHPKSPWSVKLTEEQSSKWHEFVEDVQDNLPKFSVPRQTRPQGNGKTRLCVFTDASATALAACLYEVTEINGEMHVRLVGARNKIIPHKKRYNAQGIDSLTKDSLKVNRLELTAALLGARMAEQHMAATETQYEEVLAFTDSQVTCHWLWSNTDHHTEYVRDRVAIIKTIIPPQNWRHVAGIENPADLASRGCTMAELINHKTWINGPVWLSQARNTWPALPLDNAEAMSVSCHLQCCTRSMTRKMRKAQKGQEARTDIPLPNPTAKLTSKTASTQGIKDTWDELVKDIMHKNPSEQITHTEATRRLLKEIQQKEFPNIYAKLSGKKPESILTDTEKNIIHQYALFIESASELIYTRNRNRVARVKSDEDEAMSEDGQESEESAKNRQGRDSVEHDLIFLPHSGPEIRRLVKKIHQEDTGHGSPNHVATESRQNYWILHVRKLAKDVRKNCSSCKYLDAKPVTQIEGPLPKSRYATKGINDQRPFFVTGVDFVGPFFPFKDKSKGKNKQTSPESKKCMHIAVFSCAKTRAIHMEIVPDLSFESFELAFTRFTSRRGGIPNTMYSDNAKTFQVAERLAIFTEKTAQKLQEKYETKLRWIFNASRAPWWGGFFERMMRVIKEKMARNFYRHTFPTPQHFETAVIMLEKFINSRPLTTFYSQEGECRPITPSQFLTGGAFEPDLHFLQFADEEILTKAMTPKQLRERRRKQASFQRMLWRDFQCQYLDLLRVYHKSSGKNDQSQKIQEGTYVLVTPDDTSFKAGAMLHKMMWKRAKVLKLIPGKDDRVRKVTIQWPDSRGKWVTADYPIQKLCPLELTDSEAKRFFEEK